MIDPLKRKLKYVESVATPEGVDWLSERWLSRLGLIRANVDFSSLYDALIQLFLELNLHLDLGIPNPFERYEKGVYGKSKYDRAIYDPPGVTKDEILKIARQIREWATCRDDTAWKSAGGDLKSKVDFIRDKLIAMGVAEFYADAIASIVAICEGKVISTSYFDFATFDISVFSEIKEGFLARDTKTWFNVNELKTLNAYESHFDYSLFDYSRFINDTFGLPREIIEHIHNIVDSLRRGNDVVEEYGQSVLYPRVKFLRSENKLHWRGGFHQLKIQDIQNRVKRLLNRRGVSYVHRLAYLNFALELTYLYNTTSRRYKTYKAKFSVNDLIEKYVRMGCDKDILLEIANIVGVKV